jgi:hypothetical protein
VAATGSSRWSGCHGSRRWGEGAPAEPAALRFLRWAPATAGLETRDAGSGRRPLVQACVRRGSVCRQPTGSGHATMMAMVMLVPMVMQGVHGGEGSSGFAKCKGGVAAFRWCSRGDRNLVWATGVSARRSSPHRRSRHWYAQSS